MRLGIRVPTRLFVSTACLAFAVLSLAPAPSRAKTCSGDPPCVSHISELKRGGRIFLAPRRIDDRKFRHGNPRGVPQGTGLCNRREGIS
jgi:hypothetical protein